MHASRTFTKEPLQTRWCLMLQSIGSSFYIKIFTTATSSHFHHGWWCETTQRKPEISVQSWMNIYMYHWRPMSPPYYAALQWLSSKDVLNLENNDPHKYTWKLFSFPWPSWTNMICHFVEAVVWLPKMADHHSSQSIWKTSQFLGSLLPWHVKNSEIKFWIVYQLVVSKLAKLKTWFSRKRHILLLFWPFVKLLTIWLKLENNFPQKYTWKSFVFSCNPLEL